MQFDMMGITDGPLRDWYGQLMFTNEGDSTAACGRLFPAPSLPGPSRRYNATAADIAAHFFHWFAADPAQERTLPVRSLVRATDTSVEAGPDNLLMTRRGKC